MSLSAFLTWLHAVSGGLGLLLAGPVLVAPKRRGPHVLLGRVYAVAAAAMCLSAFGLFAYDPARLAGLAVLGVLTTVWVGTGVWLARRRPRLGSPGRWRILHLNCMGSSVIAFVTGFAVQTTDGHLLAWVLPTVTGTALISWRTQREVRRRRHHRRDSAGVVLVAQRT